MCKKKARRDDVPFRFIREKGTFYFFSCFLGLPLGLILLCSHNFVAIRLTNIFSLLPQLPVPMNIGVSGLKI
jgi:hypothetical protein